MRYQCDSCGIEFEEPRKILREINHVEFEVDVCPNCEDMRYRKVWKCIKCGVTFERHTKIPAPEDTMCSNCRMFASIDILVKEYLPFLIKLEKKYEKLIEEHKPPEHECKGEHFGDGIARHMFASSKGFISKEWTGWVIGIGAVTVSIKHCPFCGEELK